MLSYRQALNLVLDRIRPLPAVEVPLEQAGGLVLAEAVTARWDLPPADNSAPRPQKSCSAMARFAAKPATS